MTSRRQFLTLVCGTLAASPAAAQLDPNMQALRTAALASAIRKVTGGPPRRSAR